MLGFIEGIGQKVTFAVSTYYGIGKPSNANEYLDDLVKEMGHIKINGIEFREIKYNILINGFLCDLPARSFIKCVICINGYPGCHYCNQELYINSVVFPELNYPCRSDESFREQVDTGHHKGILILTTLNIDMVHYFPLILCIFYT